MDRKRLGLATFLRPGFDVWRWIDLAAELGLGVVEIRAEPRMAHPDELSKLDRRRIRGYLEDAGLRATLHVPIYDLSLASLNPHVASVALAELVASVDLAADVGASVVVFHSGGLPKEYAQLEGEHERAWRRLEFALAVALPHAQGKGVKLALENKQKGTDLVITPEDHLRALQSFPDLAACLDFGHLHTVGLDPIAFANALGPRLIHVHLHDNRGQRDEHLPLGEGTLDLPTVLTALDPYTGSVILEISDPDGLRGSVELLG